MTNSIQELEDAELIFVIGSNMTEAHPVVSYYVKRAVEKGATLIVSDPRRTDLCFWAKHYVRIRPGSDIAYVNGLNKAEEKLAEARKTGDYAMVQHWERQLAFHGSGDILHTLFWQSMAANAGDEPSGELADQIEDDFGDFDTFRDQFSQAAITVEGNGWAALAWSPEYQKLYVVQIENHQKQVLADVQLIMVLDMWEHAYYLKFQNRRPDWVESWWNIANWDGISERFKAIKEHSKAVAVR